MEATKAKILICEGYIDVDEKAIADINAAIANCPVYGRYSDSPADPKKRMEIVPKLTLAVNVVDR